MESNVRPRQLFALPDSENLRRYFAEIFRTEAIQRRRADIRAEQSEQIDKYATTAKLHYSWCAYVE
jgi:hypothetical protein